MNKYFIGIDIGSTCKLKTVVLLVDYDSYHR